jgi:tripartite-type tricarboxylate transporter receptor subunit TctC
MPTPVLPNVKSILGPSMQMGVGRQIATRRAMLRLSLGGTAALAWGSTWRAQAQQLPPLDLAKILLGVPPGGLGDRLARSMADKLRGVYAANVIVENKPGVGGQLAVTAARDSAADGSVLLLTISSALAIYPFTYPKLPYKPLEDVIPVSLACYANHGLAVGPLVPASVKNIADFLAWCKANPAQANYGSPAAGSIAHLVMAAVADITKTDVRHVPYKGSGPGVIDLVGGQIAAMSAPAGVFLPHVQGGRLRLIGITGQTRSVYAPQVATYREQGFPITAREWYGLFLPGKARADAVQRANAAVKAILSQPDLVESYAALGLEVAYSTSQQLSDILKTDSDEWRDVIKRIGFTAES